VHGINPGMTLSQLKESKLVPVDIKTEQEHENSRLSFAHYGRSLRNSRTEDLRIVDSEYVIRVTGDQLEFYGHPIILPGANQEEVSAKLGNPTNSEEYNDKIGAFARFDYKVTDSFDVAGNSIFGNERPELILSFVFDRTGIIKDIILDLRPNEAEFSNHLFDSRLR
jgi:hypothetical protein